MSLAYVRNTYGVPAKRGMRVEYCGQDNVRRRGVITSASHHVRVRLDGEKHSRPYHPQDDYLIYLPGCPNSSVAVGADKEAGR